MTATVYIYVGPPAKGGREWRVSEGLSVPAQAFPDEASALAYAVDLAQLCETSGAFAEVRRERADGMWEVVRA